MIKGMRTPPKPGHSYLGDHRNGYLQSNWLLNGDFESEPSGLVLDWRIENPDDSVTSKLDSTVAHTGNRSLRIDFAGKENVNYSNDDANRRCNSRLVPLRGICAHNGY